jgi:hypothetical protein
LGDGAGVAAVEGEALADAEGGEAAERFGIHFAVDLGLLAAVESKIVTNPGSSCRHMRELPLALSQFGPRSNDA